MGKTFFFKGPDFDSFLENSSNLRNKHEMITLNIGLPFKQLNSVIAQRSLFWRAFISTYRTFLNKWIKVCEMKGVFVYD